MSPHQGWLPPTAPPSQFWPAEPPAGLGAWGRQSEHRLEAIEEQVVLIRPLIEEITDLRRRLDEIEARPDTPPAMPAPAPVPSPSPAGLLGNPNLLMLLYLVIGAVVTVATGRIPDLTAIIK